jgi:hypothetical protein
MIHILLAEQVLLMKAILWQPMGGVSLGSIPKITQASPG